MQMSLDEARLILNVKKDDPMEVIQKVSRLVFSSGTRVMYGVLLGVTFERFFIPMYPRRLIKFLCLGESRINLRRERKLPTVQRDHCC